MEVIREKWYGRYGKMEACEGTFPSLRPHIAPQLTPENVQLRKIQLIRRLNGWIIQSNTYLSVATHTCSAESSVHYSNVITSNVTRIVGSRCVMWILSSRFRGAIRLAFLTVLIKYLIEEPFAPSVKFGFL